MKYEIWQLKHEHLRAYGFMDYEWACEHGFNLEHYEKVYEGEIEVEENAARTLENLFTKFNIDRPEDFKGHSLSVSDIVVLGNNKLVCYKFYCDSLGWKKL